MRDKPQLVLDIAGVLLSNMSLMCWKEMIQETNLSADQLKMHFGSIKKQLWTGKMKEEEFWISLGEMFPELPIGRARDILFDSIVPLPAAGYLERWSKSADIHLLSNHCSEWIQPNLDSLSHYAKSVTISNQVGLCKPEIEIYQLVETHLAGGVDVLFIDDQEKNLHSAKHLGWKTLLADEEGKWTQEVESFINFQI
ncbi:HAD-IA family hydrolase [Paenibacillus polysaccharolyticus]|uniref:HAD-IA family hydrolase n=1 Tax=Paenibacillus polysaccharolyticus TaxID=582692 RepID=UPI0020A11E6F|nr:HAD-IA family hydrolase [Paenibacillus polysaccharolyticus]MCP1134446.1 HAD-IA family hydrolase [Paenibacillus polysaccharolyticus]